MAALADPIRLITFDLDDTLWPCFPTILAAEQTLFDWLAEQAPALANEHTVHSLREQRLALAQAHPHLAHDLTAMRRLSLQALAEQYGMGDDIADRGTDMFRRERNRVNPYAEVRGVLLSMRERFTLVALSNGNAQVEKTPLAGCFHHAFIAEEVGAAKPDPALFNAASSAAGVPLSAAMHVGDDPQRDIAAARALGMLTVWVNRDQQVWPPDIPPADVQIEHLSELQTHLESLA